MPFVLNVHEMHGLAVGRCDGLVLEGEVHEAIEFSFMVENMPPGIDRVCYIDPRADLHRLSPEALYRIQAHMAQRSCPQGAMPAFRTVLVAPSPFHRPIAELYKAIWDSYRLPAVQFWVVATPIEAVRLLGLPQTMVFQISLSQPSSGGGG